MKTLRMNFGLVLFLSLLPAAYAGPAQLSRVEGDVAVLRAGENQKVTEGMALEAGDVLETKTGSADVSLNGLAGFRLLEQSKAEVVSTEISNTRIRAELGDILVRIKEDFKKEKGSSFELETPTLVAAVRGTQFWGRVGNTGVESMTTLAVREGEVSLKLKASGLELNLKAGEAVDASNSLAAPSVRKAVAPELQALEQAEQIEI